MSGGVGNIVDLAGRPVRISGTDAVEAQAQDTAARVGERVRARRESRKMTRKDLAEASGVSLRYLAEVETGRGNCSIAVLTRIGAALAAPVSAFFSDAASDDLLARVAAANAAQKSAILKVLEDPNISFETPTSIALIGLRGAGKSTLGARLADAANLRFVELNAEIEAECGMGVSDIIALYGQDGFRSLEARALERVAASSKPIVLAVAGGLVGQSETFEKLLTSFRTVWLKAAPEEHMERVRTQGDHRPMAGDPAAMDALKAILERRKALYARAEMALDTAGLTEDEAFAALAELVDLERLNPAP